MNNNDAMPHTHTWKDLVNYNVTIQHTAEYLGEHTHTHTI